MAATKTWLDISHIIGWPSNLTGIERVEYNLIKYYYDNAGAGFVIWDENASIFAEVDRSFVKQEVIDRLSKQASNTGVNLSKRSVFGRIHNRLKTSSKTNAADLSGGNLMVLAGLWDNDKYISALKETAASTKLIHVVYDMIPIVQKGYVVDFLPAVFEKYMYEILPVCVGVLAISNSTLNDTQSVLQAKGLNVPKMASFRLGDDSSGAIEAKKPQAIDGDFVLSVGTIEARKNHMLLYYALKKIQNESADTVPIVLVGKRGWLTSDFQYIVDHDESVKDRLIILDKVSDSELRWLYENCLFTVFPSFYEGWGLPIAESLSMGKITLASNTSSLPEVGGYLADYFSPFSSDQLANLMAKYLNPENRAKREKAIASGYKLLKWQEAAAKFDELARQMLKDS